MNEKVMNPGAAKLYKPILEEGELLVIGNFLRQCIPSKANVYTEEFVRQGYQRFGGIFRYIFSEGADRYTHEQD